VFLQDSLDPKRWTRAMAEDQGLCGQLGCISNRRPRNFAKDSEAFDAFRPQPRPAAERAAGLGSPSCAVSLLRPRSSAARTPDQHIETTIRVLKAVRSKVMDLNVKIAIENHTRTCSAFETRQVIEGAGPEFVRSYSTREIQFSS